MIGPVNIFLVIIFAVLVPFILGLLFEYPVFKKGSENTNKIMISRCFIMGFASMLAIFQIIAVPMIYRGTSFKALLYVYISIIAAMVIASVCVNLKTFKAKVLASYSSIKDDIISLDKEHLIIGIVALLFIAFQTCLLTFFMHTDTDDTRFLSEALEAVERNTLLRVHPITGAELSYPVGEMCKDLTSPYPILIAVFSYLTRLNPAVFAHCISPALLIPLAYMTLYLIAAYLFNDKKDIPVFMLIASMVIMFSFESVYSWGYTLLTIIWQGRSIAAVIMLPFLWYVLMRIYTENNTKLLYIALVIISLANADLSGMGSLMAPILGGVFALSYFIKNRRIIKPVIMVLCVIPSGLYVCLFYGGLLK